MVEFNDWKSRIPRLEVKMNSDSYVSSNIIHIKYEQVCISRRIEICIIQYYQFLISATCIVQPFTNATMLYYAIYSNYLILISFIRVKKVRDSLESIVCVFFPRIVCI